MSEIELVVTDLDGTLWHGNEEVHTRALAAFSALIDSGMPVLVATGRRVTSTREPLARLGLTPPAVVLNGALALELATGTHFHRCAFQPSDATQVLAAFRYVGVEPCVYVEHPRLDVFVGRSPSTHPDHLRSFGISAEVGDLAEVVVGMPVLGFVVMGAEREPLIDIDALLENVGEVHLSVDKQFGGHVMTVAPTGVSKWAGVVAYCSHAGLDPGRVLAVGDGPNDRELLARAAVAVVPDDADESVRTAGHHVVGSPEVGGWAEILELI